MTAPAAFAAVSFLLGSIPFGLLFSRIFGGEDVRKKGSGNIGATNVSRVVGFWPAGFLTFLFDGLKGTLAVFIAEGTGLRWAAAAFVVAGHCFSPWLRFRGGKGVATGFGAIVLLSPAAAAAGLLGYLATFFSTRIGSLSSLAGLLLVVIAHFALPGFEPGPHLFFGAILLFIILLRHEKNIDALLEKSENRFG